MRGKGEILPRASKSERLIIASFYPSGENSFRYGILGAKQESSNYPSCLVFRENPAERFASVLCSGINGRFYRDLNKIHYNPIGGIEIEPLCGKWFMAHDLH